MKILITGSFDPITLGHLDIINRAKNISNDIIIGVFNNEEKQYMFDLDTRVRLVKLACQDIEVIGYTDFVVDFCREYNIDIIVRGFRNYIDYKYEVEMAKYNYSHGNVQTYMLPTCENLSHISSTLVRDKLVNNEPLDEYLPKILIDKLRRNI